MYSLHHGILLCSSFIFIASYADVISRNIDCKDVAGNDPQWPNVDSVATCPSGYTVTSCGSKAIIINNDDDILGAYFYGNGCKAETVWSCPLVIGCLDGGGVRAFARCCKFVNYGSSISEVTSLKSGSGDDDAASISCPGNTKMIGCAGFVSRSSAAKKRGFQYDGSIFDDNSKVLKQTCTARNGIDGTGAIAQARCYDLGAITDDFQLDCIAVFGDEAKASIVTCPHHIHSDYFMTSCNGHSFWSGLIQYTVENNYQCVAISKNDGTIASAMWFVIFSFYILCDVDIDKCTYSCRMYKHTPNPTPAPSTSPTSKPTFYPSAFPTVIFEPTAPIITLPPTVHIMNTDAKNQIEEQTDMAAYVLDIGLYVLIFLVALSIICGVYMCFKRSYHTKQMILEQHMSISIDTKGVQQIIENGIDSSASENAMLPETYLELQNKMKSAIDEELYMNHVDQHTPQNPYVTSMGGNTMNDTCGKTPHEGDV